MESIVLHSYTCQEVGCFLILEKQMTEKISNKWFCEDIYKK